MLARYSSYSRIVITCAAVLIGTLSLRAQVVDLTVPGNLTVNGNTDLQGTLDVAQGVTVIGNADLMGNIFSLGHSLNGDNSQNYSIAGLEFYIKNTNSTTRLIEQVTTVDGTTFKWGTKAATDLNANGILDDFGTEWMSLTGSILTITGNLLGNGTDNQLTAQTLTGVNSILTRGLADARYVQLASTVPVTITNATAATSSTTGALIVSGGIGAAKDSWINGVRVGKGASGIVTNTAVGLQTLDANTTGIQNTANGYQSLRSNTTGSSNTANGWGSLYSNTTGSSNTAYGLGTLYANTTGIQNTANGWGALFSNTTGSSNTASGWGSLYSNTTGNSNSAYGLGTLYANTTGNYNVANGWGALFSNTTGSSNVASGYQAGRYQADGTTALTDPETSIYFGAFARGLNNSDSNSIVIGYQAIGEGANTTVLGNSSTTSTHIYGLVNVSGLNVAGQPILTQTQAAASYQALNAGLTSIAALTTTTYGQSLLTGADAVATRANLGLGTLAIQNGTITDYLTTADAATTYQPLDADLTAIAALATTAYGTGFLPLTDAAAARTYIGASTGDVVGPASSVGNRLAVFDSTTGKLIKDSGETVTTSQPYTVAQTWNDGAVVFTGIQSNITNTGSAAGSLLMDLQVNGASKFNVDKAGNVSSAGNLNVLNNLTVAGQPVLTQTQAVASYQALNAGLTSIAALTTTTYGQSLLTGADAVATRANLGLGTLAIQNGTITDYLTIANAATTYQTLDADLTSIAALATTAYGTGFLPLTDAATARAYIGAGTGDAVGPASSVGNRLAVFGNTTGKVFKDSGETVTTSQPYTVAQTWNAGAVVFTGIQSNITDTASAAGSLLMDLQVNGASKVNVDKAGNLNVQTGKLIISNPAGGISMGEFGNP